MKKVGMNTSDKAKELGENLSFSDALTLIEQDILVTRQGWNGKDMFIFKRPEDSLSVDMIVNKVKSLPESVKRYYIGQHTWNEEEKLSGKDPENTFIKFTSYLCLKAADGSIVNGWLASQTDILAKDWKIYK